MVRPYPISSANRSMLMLASLMCEESQWSSWLWKRRSLSSVMISMACV
ncbi:MAG: hypothetical protein MR717_11100 [Prevotella sp.]|nr:hypothetical protein [Prevotella sp.]